MSNNPEPAGWISITISDTLYVVGQPFYDDTGGIVDRERWPDVADAIDRAADTMKRCLARDGARQALPREAELSIQAR